MPKFPVRQRNNLKEIAVAPTRNFSSDSPIMRSPPMSPAKDDFFTDDEEEDAELIALRRAALISRKRKSVFSSATESTAKSSPKFESDFKRTPVRPASPPPRLRAQDRLGPRQEGRRDNSTKSSSYNSQNSSKSSKFADLKLEDLEQVYRASKRSRRRGGSDDNSSEDEDFDYYEARADDSAENGSRSAASLSRQNSRPSRSERNSTSNANRSSASASNHASQRTPAADKRPDPVVAADSSSSPDDISASLAKERRRQKFESSSSSSTSIMPDESRTRVSLASLKSKSGDSSSFASQETESAHCELLGSGGCWADRLDICVMVFCLAPTSKAPVCQLCLRCAFHLQRLLLQVVHDDDDDDEWASGGRLAKYDDDVEGRVDVTRVVGASPADTTNKACSYLVPS